MTPTMEWYGLKCIWKAYRYPFQWPKLKEDTIWYCFCNIEIVFFYLGLYIKTKFAVCTLEDYEMSTGNRFDMCVFYLCLISISYAALTDTVKMKNAAGFGMKKAPSTRSISQKSTRYALILSVSYCVVLYCNRDNFRRCKFSCLNSFENCFLDFFSIKFNTKINVEWIFQRPQFLE